MTNIKDWLNDLKIKSPEQRDFIIKIEKYFTETSFNINEFELAIRNGISKIEKDVENRLNNSKDFDNDKTK